MASPPLTVLSFLNGDAAQMHGSGAFKRTQSRKASQIPTPLSIRPSGSRFSLPNSSGDSISSMDIKSSSTFNADYFEEIIVSDNDVDLERLREASKYGIPGSFRADVWKYLLDVSKPDKSEELITAKRLKEEYAKLKEEADRQTDSYIIKSIRSDLSRHSSMLDEEVLESFADRIQAIIVVYLSDHQFTEYSAVMVHLLSPLLIVLGSEEDAVIYFAFCRVMEYIELSLLSEGIENVVARFLMLFRSFQSELCGSFEDEGLSVKEWAVPWIQGLLARELPLENLLRLWDTYFASPEDPDLHMYICLAILHFCKETLVEFEHSEIKAYLENLPYMDMDQLIVQAYNIREEAKDLINK